VTVLSYSMSASSSAPERRSPARRCMLARHGGSAACDSDASKPNSILILSTEPLYLCKVKVDMFDTRLRVLRLHLSSIELLRRYLAGDDNLYGQQYHQIKNLGHGTDRSRTKRLNLNDRDTDNRGRSLQQYYSHQIALLMPHAYVNIITQDVTSTSGAKGVSLVSSQYTQA
jgi:hypothetical protein